MTEITKVDPKEFGLEPSETQTIEQAFMPKIVERDALKTIYEGLITQELTPALCSDAGDLRRKLVKVRTGIAEIHKTQKAFFLAAGRFVDAWKNKETAPIEQMEENLSAIEKHFENIEKERKAKLRQERIDELARYEVDGTLIMLGEMTDDVWNNYLAGVVLQYNNRKEAERKAEEERIAKEKAEAEERERIRVDNERLRKEAEAREKEIAAERAKVEAERKAAEKKQRKEREAAEKKLREEREAREKAEAEIRAKREAEEAAKKAAEAEAKKKANAPEKEKLMSFAQAIDSLEIPETISPEAAHILENAKGLLLKVSSYIRDNATKL